MNHLKIQGTNITAQLCGSVIVCFDTAGQVERCSVHVCYCPAIFSLLFQTL